MAQFIALAASLLTIAIPEKNDGSSPKISHSRRPVSQGFSLGLGALVVAIEMLFSYLQLQDDGYLNIVNGFLFQCQYIAVGFGLSALLRKYRIKERIRLYSYILFQPNVPDDDNTTNNPQAMKLQTILNANNSLSSHLHCAKITLKKRTALAPRVSTAVELYYVLSGEGTFHKDASTDDCKLIALEAHGHMIVQPWTTRSISNKTSEDFVFLRITDSSKDYNDEEFDKVVPREIHADTMADVAGRVSKFGEWMGITKKGARNGEDK